MGPELPAGCSCHFLALEEVSEGPDPDVEREVRCTRTDVTRQMKDEGWAGGGDSEGVGVHAGRDASIPLAFTARGLELGRKQTRDRR